MFFSKPDEEVSFFSKPEPEVSFFTGPEEAYDNAQRDAVLKVKLLSDLLFFTRYFFKKVYGKKFIVAPHHREIADTLTKVVRGEITRLIINIPPRYGKTEIAVKMFIAWIIANNKAAKSIHVSYSDDLALDNSSAVREIIKHHEFQRIFPTRLKTDSDSKKKWYTEEGGGLYSVAAGGAITGFGAGDFERICSGNGMPADGFTGAVVIDDPLKPDDSSSEKMLENINRGFNRTISNRTNSKKTPIVVIMQRLHEEDLSGFLLDGGSGDEWVHLCIPVFDKDENPLWPDKHDKDMLERMRKADAYMFAGQYMQRPSPLGGGIFKDEWWNFYKVLPEIKWRNIYADTAQKKGEKNDYSVFQCWGKTKHGIVLIDQIRGKWEAPELKKQAIAFWNKHKAVRGQGTLRSMKIEDKVSGTGLIQSLKKKGIPVIPIPRDTDKPQRARDGSPWIESGHVLIPEDAEYTSEYMQEHAAFPNGKYDDQIDPTLDAIKDMLQDDEMQFIPSDVIISSMLLGSGMYLGDDPLICGVYLARDVEDESYIQFRRGKDAISETTYKIEWDKVKDPNRVISLLTVVLDRHRPDTTFISESGVGGIITDRLNDMGYTVIRVNFFGKADEELKYKDKQAESYRALRQWMIDEGSISNDPDIEQSLVAVTHDHKKDQLVILTGNARVSALALTFAYPVPKREIPRGELDRHVSQRYNAQDYDPLDVMDIKD